MNGARNAGPRVMLLLASLFAFATLSLVAQDEPKKPPKGKKPPAMDKKKGEPKGEPKDDSKGEKDSKDSDEKKSAVSLDDLEPKQKKWAEKLRQDIEKKFKKSKKETVYVFSLHESGFEMFDAGEPPAEGGGVFGDVKGKGKGKGKPRNNQQPPGGVGRGSGSLEAYAKSEVLSMDDREAAIEKVYVYMMEFPPAEKKKGSKAKRSEELEVPPPTRRWELHAALPKTDEGSIRAARFIEEIGDKYQRLKYEQERRKEMRRKGEP